MNTKNLLTENVSVIVVIVNVPSMKRRKPGEKLDPIIQIWFLLVTTPQTIKSPTQEEKPKPIHHPHHDLKVMARFKMFLLYSIESVV